MTQKGWDELTDNEKGALTTGHSIVTCPHNDPNIAMDCAGLSGTITFDQYIDIVNNTTEGLYFKLEASVLSGDPTKWSGNTVNVGLVMDSSLVEYDWQPARVVPTSKITETIRVTISAYTDSGYTALFAQDTCDYSYAFFSHVDPLASIETFGDFEGSTWDDWNHTAGYGTFSTNGRAYTGSCALILSGASDNITQDASGANIPTAIEYISQTVDLSPYTSAYIIVHPTYLSNSGSMEAVIMIWQGSYAPHIIRIPMTENSFEPHRIAIPLLPINSTIKIAGMYSEDGDLTIDSIIVVGFS